MYDHLNDACKSGGRQLAGYITLLQCWIYDHFPSVHESVTDPEYDETSPRAYGGLLRRLIRRDSQHQRTGHGELRWGPIVVTHRPERVVRQFGYVQTIPPLPTGASLSFEDIDNRWMHYSDHLAAGGQICLVPGQCAPDYTNYIPEVPMALEAGPSNVPSDVEQPRHAVIR
ncbi:uncharacterized protein LOC114409354 [Glycine soja]|uniref:uncharacterized protein n=1 Tax=Glycine max TaxID=3847 RepID=UPI0007193B23|nr:uncharacterized protein LOC106799448 [Glycine max]XP_028228936.1 uncharacterized protein LOC114409354 [Glycine soja]|eukprot:XP_014633420.1 uncharacterized protein LOC106799448 [Glycine max]